MGDYEGIKKRFSIPCGEKNKTITKKKRN